MIILIVGRRGSGKTTAAKSLEKMGFTVKSTGDVVREEIKNRGLPYNKETDYKVSKWFNSEGREVLISRRLLKDFKGGKLVIEGLRTPEQIKEIKKITGETPVIIAVKADFETKVKRLLKRRRFKDETIDYLKRKDKEEIQWGEDKVIEMADYTIDNTNLDINEFREKVRDVVEKILKEESKGKNDQSN